jgi:phage tail sheath gpL-like
MAITFNEIPAILMTPGVYSEIDTSNAVQGVQLQPHEILIIGQKLAAGTMTADTPYACATAYEASLLAGEGSELHLMVRAFKAQNSLTPVTVIGVADNGAGIQAVQSITWTGPATETRELVFYIGGVRIPVSVTSGDAAATIETNALAAISLVRDLPVVASANAGTGIDITHRHKGTVGNATVVGHSQMPGERPPAGVVVTVTELAPGSTDPTFTAAITAMQDVQYHTVVAGLASATLLGALVTEMESRGGAMRAIEGVIFACENDTRANLTTLGNSFNSESLCLVGVEVSALMPSNYEIAAAIAGIDSAMVQVNPAKNNAGRALVGMRGPKKGSRFTRAERDILLSDGVATLETGADGGLRICRCVTTYQSNALAIPDTALQELQTVRLLSAIRYSTRARIGLRFEGFSIASNGTPIPPGATIATPNTIRGELVSLFLDWQNLGWVEGLDQFKSELVVERNLSDPNRVDVVLPPDLINSLLITAVKISFRK